jgi:hypothetical protein
MMQSIREIVEEMVTRPESMDRFMGATERLAIMKCPDCQQPMRPVTGSGGNRGKFLGSYVCACGKAVATSRKQG